MLLRLLLLFTVVPLVELALLVQIGQRIGLGPTIALVLLTGVLGAWLTRLQGLRVLGRVRSELEQGRMPAAELVDGLLIVIAGAVLLTPGLLTDLCGFFLLVPAGRRVIRRAVTRAFRGRVQGGATVMDARWERVDGE